MTPWVSIKESIPPLVGDYLVWVEIEEYDVPRKYRPYIAFWNGNGFEDYSDLIRVYIDTVTHWAEAPKEPK